MSMTLEELGQLLRAEREKKNLSVEDVAFGLKISSRVLRALEAGDAVALPHAVYVRGFVSAYGKFLELDVQELLAEDVLYEEGEEAAKPSSFERPPVQQKKKSSFVPFLLLLGFVSAAGAGVWFFRDAALFSELQGIHLSAAQPAPALPQEEKSQSLTPKASEQKSAPVQAAPAVASATTEATEASKTAEKTTPKASDASSDQKQKVAVVKSESTKPVAAPKSQVVQASTVQAVKQEQKASSGARLDVVGPHKIIITALTDTWLHSAADNASKRQFSLKPGDTFALTFEETLSLTLGNAGGVRIHYNGKEVASFGRDGEEKTVIFPPK